MKTNTNALVLQQTALFVQHDFEVEEAIPDDVTEAELLAFIAEQVRIWLDTNMEHLFYVLYRLDINELKVRQALSPSAIEMPSEAIAQLIFDREKQKATSRIQYRAQDKTEGDGWNS